MMDLYYFFLNVPIEFVMAVKRPPFWAWIPKFSICVASWLRLARAPVHFCQWTNPSDLMIIFPFLVPLFSFFKKKVVSHTLSFCFYSRF